MWQIVACQIVAPTSRYPNCSMWFNFLLTKQIESSVIALFCRYAQVAQSVEQRTENPRVDGSIPPLGTIFKKQATPQMPR